MIRERIFLQQEINAIEQETEKERNEKRKRWRGEKWLGFWPDPLLTVVATRGARNGSLKLRRPDQQSYLPQR
jgi:hypothetical protein